MRPRDIARVREEIPVVYVPLGTLEWHGLHNPMGADGLQAEELCLRCAAQGGVVFPPVYYGESRVNSLLETDPRFQGGICERMGLPPDAFSEEKFPCSGMQQLELYQRLLIQIMAEAASYGFALVVFVAGHYPLVEPARCAVLTYNQWAYDKPWKRIGGLALADYLLLRPDYAEAGDHAGGWETSHLLCSDPDTVDLSLAEKELQFGIFGSRDPHEADARFGEEIYDRAAERITERVRRWMERPQFDHGLTL